MSTHREVLIRTAARESNLPEQFVTALQAECPWLDGAEEISERLGSELLSEQMVRAEVSTQQVARFIGAYNALVRAHINPFEPLQSQAYAEVCASVTGQGRADAFGDGDYWVNESSFSSRVPTIIVFNGFRFSENALHALQSALSKYPSIFSEFRISCEEGAEVKTLRPQ